MPTSDRTAMTAERLAAFGDAWRARDVDALMTFMAEDCVYRASVGPEPGKTYRGRDEVRRGFAEVLAFDHAAEGRSGEPVIAGDRGAGAWVLERVGPDGEPVIIEGCDLFEFDGDLIRVKDAYRKVRTELHVPHESS